MSEKNQLTVHSGSKMEVKPLDDSIKELSTQFGHLVDKSSRFLQIFSRAGDPDAKSLVEFFTLGDKELDQIVEKMPEINRATKAFGKQNTQVTGRLMSLTMLGTSAYHRIKQCLAKIERKRGALKENIYRLRRDKINLDRLLFIRDKLRTNIDGLNNSTINIKDIKLMSRPTPPSNGPPPDGPPEESCPNTSIPISIETTSLNKDELLQELVWQLQEIEIDVEEKIANISDSNIYVEAALKEIGHYQTAYEQIMKNCNIPADWNEKDFEMGEVEEHVKMAFLHAVRDVMMTGRLNVGTHEYLEQFGIHPYTAYLLVKNYLASIEKEVNENKNFPSVESLHDFLDKMHENFKDEYLLAIKRIGLDHLLDDTFLYTKKEFTEE